MQVEGRIKKWDQRPWTLKVWPNTLIGSGIPELRAGTLKGSSQEIFVVFYEAWILRMNSCTSCI